MSSTDKIALDHDPTWEIQAHETVTQYGAFCVYRDMGEGRSLEKVARAWSKSGTERLTLETPKRGSRGAPVSEIAKWSSRNRWVERADAYWLHIERRLRHERETDIARTNGAHA